MHQTLGWLSVLGLMGVVLFAAYAPQAAAWVVFRVLTRSKR